MAAKRGGGRIKTVVYLDVLLLTNFLLAYFLLLAAGALVFAVVNLRRLEKTRTKWLYMAGCAAWIGLLAVGFVRAQLWK